MLEKGDVIALHIQAALVDRRHPRQRVQVLDQRHIRVVHGLAGTISIADASELAEGLAVREINDLEVKLLANHEVYGQTRLQALGGARADVRSDKADLEVGV